MFFLDFYLLVFDFFALGIEEKRRNKISQFQIRDLQKSGIFLSQISFSKRTGLICLLRYSFEKYRSFSKKNKLIETKILNKFTGCSKLKIFCWQLSFSFSNHNPIYRKSVDVKKKTGAKFSHPLKIEKKRGGSLGSAALESHFPPRTWLRRFSTERKKIFQPPKIVQPAVKQFFEFFFRKLKVIMELKVWELKNVVSKRKA